MKIVVLLGRMVRWRVALTLVLFTLLGAAWDHGLTSISLHIVLAVVGIVASYACATSVNDLADIEIDKVNLPGDSQRPLVNGEATSRDLILTAIAASVVSIACGLLIGRGATVILILSLVVNLTYSLRPIQISHRPLLTPFYLPIGYVVLPFLVGWYSTGGGLRAGVGWPILALYLLFLGRIILKDFRDRVGDTQAGKQTYLLKYGKSQTVSTSFVAILMGYVLLLAILLQKIGWPSLILVLYFFASSAMLYRLKQVPEGREEQTSIGVGAKMGNGMLLTVLGLIILNQRGVPAATLLVAALSLAAFYGYNFLLFVSNPEQSVIVYKR